MNREEFDGRPFVAGSLIGIRSFRVDADARLTGVVHEQVWKPDVNEAACLLGPYGRAMHQFAEKLRSAGLGPRPHAVGGIGCQCGFYAYFKGRNSYMGPGNVAGIVEGFGVCAVGSRGFRAEKARLVALVAPRRRRMPRTRRAVTQYLGGVRKVVRPPLHKMPHALAGMIWRTGRLFGRARSFKAGRWLNGHCEALTSIMQNALGLTIALGAGHLLGGWLGWLFWLIGMSIIWATPSRRKQPNLPPLSPAEFEAVRRNYPDVPVYRSRRTAVRAHRLTPPDKTRVAS